MNNKTDIRRQFLKTYEDLETTSFAEDEGEALKSALPLRRLLLDPTPLAVRARALFNQKLLLRSPDEKPGLPLVHLKLQDFVGFRLTRTGNVAITPADLIRYFAHVDGVVHVGEPHGPSELEIEAMRQSTDPAVALWPVTALRSVGEATLRSLEDLRDEILGIDRFEGQPGLSIYLVLALERMGGDRDNVILDIGVERHRQRLTVFVDDDDRFCVRHYDNCAQRLLLRSPPDGSVFQYQQPLTLSIRVGIIGKEMLVACELPSWRSVTVRPNTDAIAESFGDIVLGSDFEGVGRSLFKCARVLVYMKIHAPSQHRLVFNDCMGVCTTRDDWVQFDGDKFMHSRGHRKLGAVGDLTGSPGDMVQGQLGRRPTLLRLDVRPNANQES